jgi:hypothetical protein
MFLHVAEPIGVTDHRRRLNIILSICNVSLMVSYIICISTFLAMRFRTKSHLPAHKFSLGRAGAVVNVIALC